MLALYIWVFWQCFHLKVPKSWSYHMAPSPTQTLLAERGKTHGHFSNHARVTQELKATFHKQPNWSKLSDEQKEALEMVAHKIGRILAGNPNHKDHWADGSGYFQLVANALPSE
jgi:hypothetical protein